MLRFNYMEGGGQLVPRLTDSVSVKTASNKEPDFEIWAILCDGTPRCAAVTVTYECAFKTEERQEVKATFCLKKMFTVSDAA